VYLSAVGLPKADGWGPFYDKQFEQFVARYIERPPSLEKLSIQDHIVTYPTKNGTAHEFDALEFLALFSCPSTRAEALSNLELLLLNHILLLRHVLRKLELAHTHKEIFD